MLSMLNNARISKNYRMRRDITIYVTIGCNQHVIPNSYFSHNSTVDSYPNLIPYCWHPFPAASIFLPDCYSFMDIYVLSQHSFRINSYAIRMPDIKTCTDFCSSRQFYMIKESCNLQHCLIIHLN